ncbi:MAG: glutamyl-tRNA reductase [Bacteroidia bacterium]|nr:glutamyl-tRNA reductase [Bacteroidia bacterium]
MLNRFKVITATHKTAPFKALGSYVIGDDLATVSEELKNIKITYDLEEVYYLATCNRVIFLIATDQVLGEDFKKVFLEALYDDSSEDVMGHFQMLPGESGVMHLHKVACSMDSMVVGEREILRQMRDAYNWGRDQGLSGDSIRILFKSIVKTAKHIYSNTRIGEKPVSIVSLAMQEMNKNGLQKNARILMVGAGKTNSLVSKFLVKLGYKNVDVFNRSIDGAKRLAERLDGAAYDISELENYAAGFDALIVCTASVEPLITSELYQKLLRGDTSKKVIVDLSVPNNVAPDVIASFDQQYICVESLKKLSEENLKFRHTEVEKADTILIQAVDGFKKVYKQRTFENAFQNIPSEIKAVKHHAIQNVFKSDMDQLDDTGKALVLKMMAYMEKKCIGIPMKAARELAD